MSLRIYVDAYSGYKANERPRLFDLDGEVYEIASVLDRWYEPSATYFKVRTTDSQVFILRYDEQADEWTVQSGFDGDELLARPGIAWVPDDAGVIRSANRNRLIYWSSYRILYRGSERNSYAVQICDVHFHISHFRDFLVVYLCPGGRLHVLVHKYVRECSWHSHRTNPGYHQQYDRCSRTGDHR
jgi:hypothetical protein